LIVGAEVVRSEVVGSEVVRPKVMRSEVVWLNRCTIFMQVCVNMLMDVVVVVMGTIHSRDSGCGVNNRRSARH
jgi:hypothetical protein